MIHLFKVSVSTDMVIAAKSKEAAISTAKIYAADEISEKCEIDINEIKKKRDIPADWVDLYPYISNKCLDRQIKCHDLVAEIESRVPEVKQEKAKPAAEQLPKEKVMEKVVEKAAGPLRQQFSAERIEENIPSKQKLPKMNFQKR